MEEQSEIEVTQTPQGWLARLRNRGLAHIGPTREEAVKEVKETAELVDRLARQWTAPAS